MLKTAESPSLPPSLPPSFPPPTHLLSDAEEQHGQVEDERPERADAVGGDGGQQRGEYLDSQPMHLIAAAPHGALLARGG